MHQRASPSERRGQPDRADRGHTQGDRRRLGLTLLLLIPTVAIAIVLQPGVSFTTLLWVSALAGVGGGNFASSMTNINAFFPARLKGWALGVNAGGGNLGVAVAQLVGLAVLALGGAWLKGVVIVESFMALRDAPGWLRASVHGWLTLLCGGLSASFLSGG